MNQVVDAQHQIIATISFEAWMEKAIPLYIEAFHAFMSVVKDKKNQAGEVVVECSVFYDALQVTRELFNSDHLLKELESVMIAPALYVEIEPFIISIRTRLEEIQNRCIKVEGASCIHQDDFFSFIKLLVEVISEFGIALSSLITSVLEPFNDFIRDFNAAAAINLVHGDYHLLVTQEVDQLEESRKSLAKDNQKLKSLVEHIQRKAEPEVYVLCDKDDLLSYVNRRWRKQIVLTQHAVDSLMDSPYKDIKRIVSAFDLLGDQFYQVYAYGLRMDEAKAASSAVNIEFKPSMSDTSMGRHAVYDRKYNGRDVDFNRHLCIGTSRSPDRCFRVHFEWDGVNQKIVVHHAGSHLPVSDD